MKKILVTGSSGYLGSVLLQYLTERGYDCTGYDTYFFRDALLYPAYADNTKFIDARDIIENDLAGFDVVIHFAGISNDPVGKLDPALIYDPTRIYAKAIASMCKKLGIRFIFASSCSIYGLGKESLLTEESEVFPQTAYSLNKLQVEQDLCSLADKDFSPIALRFATVFGPSPRIRFDVVINMLTGMAIADKMIVLNSDGKAWRPNLHIMDVCKSILCSIDFDYKGGELLVLNVGSDENNLQIIEIAKIIQCAVPGCELKFLNENPELDKEGLIRDRKVQVADTRTYKVSFEKIKQSLPGFEQCDWSVEKGVIDLAAKFLEIGLTREIFKKRGFYRLQQLEHIYENGFISDDLIWIKNKPNA